LTCAEVEKQQLKPLAAAKRAGVETVTMLESKTAEERHLRNAGLLTNAQYATQAGAGLAHGGLYSPSPIALAPQATHGATMQTDGSHARAALAIVVAATGDPDADGEIACVPATAAEQSDVAMESDEDEQRQQVGARRETRWALFRH
jgi:hypothetical protein